MRAPHAHSSSPAPSQAFLEDAYDEKARPFILGPDVAYNNGAACLPQSVAPTCCCAHKGDMFSRPLLPDALSQTSFTTLQRRRKAKGAVLPSAP